MAYTETAQNEQTRAESVNVKGTTYYRLGKTEGVTALEAEVCASQFDSMFFEVNRDITDEELYQLTGLIGYLWRTTVKGERLTDVRRYNENSFEIVASLASSSSNTPLNRFDQFAQTLNDFIEEGSDVRNDGTQKVKGMPNTSVTVWVDEVVQQLEPKNFNKNSKMERLAARPSPFAPELLSGKSTEEIIAKVTALVSIKESLTPGEQDILTMAHDLMVAYAELSLKIVEAENAVEDAQEETAKAEAKLEAVRSALSA